MLFARFQVRGGKDRQAERQLVTHTARVPGYVQGDIKIQNPNSLPTPRNDLTTSPPLIPAFRRELLRQRLQGSLLLPASSLVTRIVVGSRVAMSLPPEASADFTAQQVRALYPPDLVLQYVQIFFRHGNPSQSPQYALLGCKCVEC
jgi:hypothetical protein